jgi:hypothetical protein
VIPNACFVGVGGYTQDGALGFPIYAQRDIHKGEEIFMKYEFDKVNISAPIPRELQVALLYFCCCPPY